MLQTEQHQKTMAANGAAFVRNVRNCEVRNENATSRHSQKKVIKTQKKQFR